MIPHLAKYLTLLKISLDAVSPDVVARVTQGASENANRAILAAKVASKAGINVAINSVAMQSTISEIPHLIKLCREINGEGEGHCHLSILDFYYSPERRDIWQREFVSIQEIEPSLASLYGPAEIEHRFGCRFLSFNANGVRIRLKDSSGTTLRAAKCGKCTSYCQEGIYGIKHSLEGWVTTCPSNEEHMGAQLHIGLSDAEADDILAPILADVTQAKPDALSFQKLLAAHTLSPATYGLQTTITANGGERCETANEKSADAI
jgi:MoaA/NifB/PqqE/SkfB family radical SAM enzyme